MGKLNDSLKEEGRPRRATRHAKFRLPISHCNFLRVADFFTICTTHRVGIPLYLASKWPEFSNIPRDKITVTEPFVLWRETEIPKFFTVNSMASKFILQVVKTIYAP